MDRTRRRILIALSGAVITSIAGCSALQDVNVPMNPRQYETYSLKKLGHSLLSAPGAYAEGSISPDGRYGVVGTGDGNGTFLVDLKDLDSPTELHYLPSSDRSGFHNLDVKFDSRWGLYYRTQESANDKQNGHSGDGEDGNIEVIDFGFGEGSPESPRVIGQLDVSSTHNLSLHPDRSLVYAAITRPSDDNGLAIWDVSDPADPTQVGKAWPHGGLHDIVVDPDRELIHCASGKGYAILDISDPESPEELGWFKYAENRNYTEIGTPGYEGAHYANFDPRRDLAVVGDELPDGIPGGKHIFDIGWDKGSPEDPQPIGFTHSPNAKVRDQAEHGLWTTHNHDVIAQGQQTLLVSGDYSEGVVLYDITDPTAPEPIDSYRTDDGADETHRSDKAPWAWSAVYHPGREFIFVSDKVTGVYTFKLTTE